MASLREPEVTAAPGIPPPAELQLGKTLLLRVCWLTMAAMAAVGAMMFLTGVYHPGRFLGQLLIAAVALGGLLLARANRLQAAARFMAWGLVAAIAYFGFITGGHLAPSTMAYFVIVAAAGWFLGLRSTVALAAASVAALGLLAYAEPAGWLPQPAPTNPMFRWLTQAIIFTVGTLLIVAASRAMAVRLNELDRARQGLYHALDDLSEREALLRMVANNVPAMIFFGDRDMRCRWANESYARFMGQTTQGIVGMHVRDIVGEQLFLAVRPHLERVLAGEKVAYEATRADLDGEARQLEIDLLPALDRNGAVQGWFGMMRDVTERRRREQLLPSLVKGTARTTGGAFFSSLVAQIGQAFGVDYAMVAETAEANTRAKSLAFWSAGGFLPAIEYELAGAPCRLVVENGSAYYERGVAALFPDDAPLAARGIEGYCGLALLDGAGGTIGLLVVMHTSPLKLSPEQKATMEIFASRAGAELERLRLEDSLRESNVRLEHRVEQRTAELAAANRELEAFSYSVSHDLRAPLRHIGGYTRLLAEDCADKLDKPNLNFIERILHSVERMECLISDMLELSKVGRVEMKTGQVNLSYLANELAGELEHAHPDRHVDWRIADGLLARGDARLLRVAIQNLVGNAWKYTGKTASPRIEIGREDGAFYVRDNGAGFDMKYAGKLFQPFQRLHGAGEFEGTGVGLATVARIVERHEGRIWAEAAPGLGATFRFTLPEASAPSCGD